jgi:hypothetical protein
LATERYYKITSEEAIIIREQGLFADMTGFRRAESLQDALEKAQKECEGSKISRATKWFCGAKVSAEAMDFVVCTSEEYLVANGYERVENFGSETRAKYGAKFGCITAEAAGQIFI